MEMKIKELLSKQGKTAVWLSKQIGVTDVNTRNIVNGVIKPKLDTLEKIAKALNVPMWELFVSPEEIRPNIDTTVLTCPKCGAKLKVIESKD